MMSPHFKRNVSRIVPFGLMWFLFSLVYSILERGIIGNLKFYPATGNPYNFISNLFITPIVALIFGLLIGAMEILYLNKMFVHKNFTEKIIYKSLIYLVIITSFLVGLTAMANAMTLGRSIFSNIVWDNVRSFLFDYAFLSVTTYMAATIFISQFYNEVSENMGHAVLMNFFKGRYHNPKEESRIFMFLDMTSSTTIAEKLGHVKYFEMLRAYYADLADPIIRHSGEIYQYVGDEIVVSWTLKNGVDNNNCIDCFFAIKATIKKKERNYLERFDVVPGFRAGFHFGKVTTGEIGALKKEIIFTGDVLNTTSRIQGLCKHYKEDIVVSDLLLEKLNLNKRFEIRRFGETELRGKDERINVSAIYLNTNNK